MTHQDPLVLRQTLEARAAKFFELIRVNPASALAMALPDETAAALRKALPEAALESRGKWQGKVEAIITDDFEMRQSHTRWYLKAKDQRFEVFWGNTVSRPTGAEVVLQGVALSDRLAVENVMTVPIEAVSESAQACTTLGVQNIAVLMVTTPSNPNFGGAWTPVNLQHAFFGSVSDAHSTDSLNGMWWEMSYGNTGAAGTVFGPIALSQDYTCDQSGELLAAAVNAADGIVDFTQYTRLALVFAVANSCPGAAAWSTIGCTTISSPTKGSLLASVFWMPAAPTQTMMPVGLFAHEMGHSLGMGHSSTEDFGNIPLGPVGAAGTTVEYGDPFSLMGYPYNGAGTTGLSGQYAAQHKSLNLHWLDSGGYQEVTSPGTYVLRPYELNGLRALRVMREGASGEWLWLEYRQPIGDIDSNLQNLTGSNAFSGALIHHENPALSSYSYKNFLLDFNPSSMPNNFNNAALGVGRTWIDPFSPLTLTVNGANTDGLSLNIDYRSPCATLSYSSTTFDAAGGSGTISISAPSDCSWTANTSAAWISFSGPVSGQGNGSVNFAIAQNNLSQQRYAYISLAGKVTSIMQSSEGRSLVIGVSPDSGKGDSGRFAFQLNNPYGYSNISLVSVDFEPHGACLISVFPSFNTLTFAGPVSSFLDLNSPGASITNGKCTVFSTGTSISGSGNTLTVTLQMSFAASFSGTHRILVAATDKNGYSSGSVPLGYWVVPESNLTAKKRKGQLISQ